MVPLALRRLRSFRVYLRMNPGCLGCLGSGVPGVPGVSGLVREGGGLGRLRLALGCDAG